MAEKPTMSKSELAEKCGVSAWKVAQWVNRDFYQDLLKLGYHRRQQIFTPAQTEFLKKNIIELNANLD